MYCSTGAGTLSPIGRPSATRLRTAVALMFSRGPLNSRNLSAAAGKS